MSEETKPEAPAKPGIRTTEFWLTAIVTIAGLVAASGIFPETSPWFKIAGLIVSAGSALGYTAVRGGVKKAAQIFLLVLLPLSLSACSNKGYIRADAIDGLIEKVCDRHDRFVRGEPTAEDKDPKNRETFLRSTELLRKLVKEAKEK